MRTLLLLFLLKTLLAAPLFAQDIGLFPEKDTIFVEPGKEIYIELRVAGFQSIATFQFSQSYDTSRLTLLSVQPGDVPNLISNPDNGIINVAWIDNSGNGLTLLDSSVVYRLKFRAGNLYPATTIVDFASSPLPTEFYQWTGIGLISLNVQVTPIVVVIRHCETVLDLGEEQDLCSGDSVRINAVCNNCQSIVWEDGTQNPSIWANVPGLYRAIATAPQECYAEDSVLVTEIARPVIGLLDSVHICQKEVITISADVSADVTVWWSTGETNTEILATAAESIYYVTATNADGCTTTDSVQLMVKPLPIVELLPDTALCTGESVNLSVNIANSIVEWSNGMTGPNTTVFPPTTVFVRVTLAGCTASDTMEIIERIAPSTFDLGEGGVVCDTTTVLLQVPENIVADTYTWSDGSREAVLEVNAAGIYSVSVMHEGCIVADTIEIEFEDCRGPVFYIPNAFAPESGGENAFFGVFFKDISTIKAFEMNIYDRWGGAVFHAENANMTWDGRVHGKDALLGVYVYWVKIDFENGQEIFERGEILLVR